MVKGTDVEGVFTVKLCVLTELELVQTSRLRHLPVHQHMITHYQITSDITLSGLKIRWVLIL